MSSLLRHRFGSVSDPFTTSFVASVDADRPLVPFDIAGSIAHAAMLEKRKILTRREGARLRSGLVRILREWEAGRFVLSEADEDVHMNVEQRLRRLVGRRLAAKLHTARSRNDQIAVDLRLWLRARAKTLGQRLGALRSALIKRAQAEAATVLPGITHLQHAQVVTFGHVLLAYHDRIARDAGRVRDAARRADVSPLGAGALAGTSLSIDPKDTARRLGFRAAFENSIDAVSDRDFAVEFVSACALLAAHLSSMAEDFILWSTPEFGFIELPDALTTSSSMLPQKKNPDTIELVRAKAAVVTGHLVSLLGILKAQPLGYNRDLQETKPPLFAAAAATEGAVQATTAAVTGMRIDRSRMAAAAADPGLVAIDLVEHLVSKGVPFRDAHGVVARLVRDCAAEGRSLLSLDDKVLRRYSPALSAAVAARLTPLASAKRRRSPGGTSPSLVAARARRLASSAARLSKPRAAARTPKKTRGSG